MHKRFYKSRREQEGDPGLDISSLIDVCFLLLIYFLVATTIQKKETDVPLQLPGDPQFATAPRNIEPLLIQIDAQGAIHVGAASSSELLDTDPSSRDVPLLLNRLRLFADGVRAGHGVPFVQVQVGDGANQQRVIDVLNAFVATNIRDITFSDLVDP